MADATTDRAAWLRNRQQGIGASDVAAILGLSPFKNAIDVYLSKITPIEDGPEKMEPMQEWGLRMEPVISAAVTDHYGWKLEKARSYQHRDYDFLHANPDRVYVAGPGWSDRELCEFKNINSFAAAEWGAPDTAEVPQLYWIQGQQQLEVCDLETCWVFVLIGGSDFRRYRIERDREYLPLVIDKLTEFWECVKTRTPPDADWEHPNIVQSIKKLHEPQPGKTVELDQVAAILVDEYQKTSAEIKSLESHKEELQAKLIDMMAGAELGYVPTGEQLVYRTVNRSGYTVAPKSYSELRIKKAK